MEKLTRICEICGKGLIGQQTNCCSIECRDIRRKNISHEKWKDVKTRVCSECSVEKEVVLFSKDHGIPKSICRKCNNGRNKKRYDERKEQYKPSRKEYYQNIQLKKMEYCGKKCMRCGYDKSLRAINFHHLNQKQKTNGKDVFGNWRYGFERFKRKVDSCDFIMLCANCHAERHDNLFTDDYLMRNYPYRKACDNENV